MVNGVTGSVLVTSPGTGNHTTSFPQAGMTLVGVYFTGRYLQIFLDPSRLAIIPNTGKANTGMALPMRRVHKKIDGQVLNWNTADNPTTVVFYYGPAPLEDSTPLETFAGTVVTTTLSGGAGTAAFTFPKGPLTLTGIAAVDSTGANAIHPSFATSTGTTLDVFINSNSPLQNNKNTDIVPLNLTAAETLTVTLAGTGSDVIDTIIYYQM